MNGRSVVFPILLTSILISGCGRPSAVVPINTPNPPTAVNVITPLATLTPNCVSSEPAAEDIERALSFTGDIFNADWEKSYILDDNRVRVTWVNSTEGAVAYLEALIFACGYEDLDLDKYFSDENWGTIFVNYQSYEQQGDMCQTDDGLRLYEFALDNQGTPYHARYWVQNDTDTRVIVLMLVFPSESSFQMDEYSMQVFPQLPNCS